MSILASAIRSLRKGKNLTTTELAELVGVRQSSVSRWEHEGAIPSPKALYSLMQLAQEPERQIFQEALGLQVMLPSLDCRTFELFLAGGEIQADRIEATSDRDRVKEHEFDRKNAHELLEEIFSSGSPKDVEWILGNLRNFVEAIRSRGQKRRQSE